MQFSEMISVMLIDPSRALHREDGGSMVLRNSGILPHHFTAS
jgi:hypothetical protein